ncbi:hypothetical protein V6M85_01600 [Sulfolobus tengchongensis]|uniref:Uncharacterized protein n=1 Tax=Sulfolobus tengchongensis TaxID=207809 RepID=A0AAX4L1E2_9CREN
MPKCKNGHEMNLASTCSICGQPIDYYASLYELTHFPKIQYKVNDIVIYVGVTPYRISNTLLIDLNDEEKIEQNKIVLKLISGGTWQDYLDQYKEKLARIFDVLGVNETKRKLIILNASHPLSPLVISLINSNAIFLIILPEENEPLIYLDTAYNTVFEASKKKEPIILVTKGIVEKFRAFYPDTGISYGIEGFLKIFKYLYDNYDRLYNFFKVSLKFNSQPFFPFSYIIGGTMLVFKDIQSVFSVIDVQKTIEFDENASNTLLLVNISPKELKEQIEKQYRTYISSRFRDIIYNDIIFIESPNSRVTNDIFNLIMFYGVSSIKGLEYLSKSHELFTKRVTQNA